MGWSYGYLIVTKFPGDIQEKALQNPLFRDLTEASAKAREFEEQQRDALASMLKSRQDTKAMIAKCSERSTDPLVAELVASDRGVEGEPPVYCVLFHKFSGAVIVQYTSRYFDVGFEWTKTALGLLHQWGCRGRIISVHANSVSDGADINVFQLTSRKIAVVHFKERKGDAPYESTFSQFKGSPVDLMEVHKALLGEKFPAPFLVLGFRTADLAKSPPPGQRLEASKEEFAIKDREQ